MLLPISRSYPKISQIKVTLSGYWQFDAHERAQVVIKEAQTVLTIDTHTLAGAPVRLKITNTA